MAQASVLLALPERRLRGQQGRRVHGPECAGLERRALAFGAHSERRHSAVI